MNESGTFLGYSIACPAPGCTNQNAWLIPDVEYLNGVGEGGLVRYTHRVDCDQCDGSST